MLHMVLMVPMVRMDNGKTVTKHSGYKSLILIITHWCNYNCIYCPVPKARKSISVDIARKTVDIFISQCGRKGHIRFFGGEPLLKFPLIKKIIFYAKNKAYLAKKKLSFDITTNGTLINNDLVEYIKANPEIELIVSLDGDIKTQSINRRPAQAKKLDSYTAITSNKNILNLPKLTVNMVIAPNQSSRMFRNFKHILKLGFRRFNFLPAYYVLWNDKDFSNLKCGFDRIAKFIINQPKDIYVKNKYVLSDTPLFNKGLVVDYNGDIFFNNLVLSRHFAHLRKKLKAGNVKENSFLENNSLKAEAISKIIEQNGPNNLLVSAHKADDILTCFVRHLANEKSRH